MTRNNRKGFRYNLNKKCSLKNGAYIFWKEKEKIIEIINYKEKLKNHKFNFGSRSVGSAKFWLHGSGSGSAYLILNGSSSFRIKISEKN